MELFNYEQSSENLADRFSQLSGYGLWRELVNFPTKEKLHELRKYGLSEVALRKNNLPKPRVFISHRQADKAPALLAAQAANLCGFDYWLDVLDPKLQALGANPSPDSVSILTAAIIEMALINCTHVLALLTPQTLGSMWVPYEYGRITDLPFAQGRAAAWVDPLLTNVPEYLFLGVIAPDLTQVKNWLNLERTAWKNGAVRAKQK